MKGMFMVARRDLAAYLNNYWGYAIIAVLLVLEGLMFNAFALTDRPKYSSDECSDYRGAGGPRCGGPARPHR